MDWISDVPDPLLYGFAVVLFGGWIGLLWMVRLMFVGKLCSGRERDDYKKQRDKWEGIALRSLGVADKATGAAEGLRDIAAALPDPAKNEEAP